MEHWCLKDKWPFPIHDQDVKYKSGTSSILKSPKSWLEGHGCSLHLYNKDREPKFGTWVYKNQWPYPNHDQDAKPQTRTKAQNQDLKDMDVLCTFKNKIESQTLEYGCTKDQWPYLNHDQHSKPPPESSRILQSPKLRFKGNICSLHLENQDREQKFRIWVYPRPVTISKSR